MKHARQLTSFCLISDLVCNLQQISIKGSSLGNSKNQHSLKLLPEEKLMTRRGGGGGGSLLQGITI